MKKKQFFIMQKKSPLIKNKETKYLDMMRSASLLDGMTITHGRPVPNTFVNKGTPPS